MREAVSSFLDFMASPSPLWMKCELIAWASLLALILALNALLYVSALVAQGVGAFVIYWAIFDPERLVRFAEGFR